MKQVVIGMQNGKPYVISASKNVHVVIREEKRRSIRKVLRAIWYRATH